MTEGIRKETLLEINPWQYDNQQDLLNAILGLCDELDQWIPIENAPKDKPIQLFYPYNNRQLIYQYHAPNGWGLYVEFDYVHPTHYKPLSDDPK